MKKPSRKVLIDQFAELALTKADAERKMKALRPFVLELGDGVHAGKDHVLAVDTAIRSSISVSVAKSLLTAAQLAEATTVSDVTTIRVEN